MINSIATVKSSELWDTILSSRNYHSAARAPLPLSTDHQDTNEHVVVPTLRRISGMTVASNLEHIPPGVLGVALSESHWDTIVKYRHEFWGGGSVNNNNDDDDDDRERSAQFSNQQQRHCHRIRQLALPEKILIAIEQHPTNTHISQSHSADIYFWRDIVNKSYPNIGGIYRPITLSHPVTFVKYRLIQLGNELLELLATPVTKEEYKRMNELSRVDNDDHVYKSTDNNGDDDDDDEEEEYSIKLIDGYNNDNGLCCITSTSNVEHCYERDMKLQTKHRTKALQSVIHELHHLPMDSTLLLETGIGKTMTKAIKILKKLVKQMKIKINDNYTTDDDDEMEQLLLGYPTFWKGNWGGISNGNALTKASLLTQLQQLLQEWKDNVSSENNIFNLDSNKTSTMTTTKRKIGRDDAIIGVPSTGGRDNKVSAAQHSIDMKLLHASPDWRKLLQSLRTRESDMKKLHGDRVRSRREDLEKHRPKIGKVVLRTTMAVGRDRESSSSGLLLKHPTPQPTKRQDDILSKSRGHRARMQQLAKSTSSSSSTAAAGGTSNGALARIRTESKVAASWSKSSFGGKSASKLSFGASVASASSTGVSPTAKVQQHLQGKSKIHVALGNGKRMTLPPSSSFFVRAASGEKNAVVEGRKVSLELSVRHKEAKTTERNASTSLSQVEREKKRRKVAAIEKKKR